MKNKSLPKHISLGPSELGRRPILIEGEIARESSYSEGLVNKRWAVLFGPTSTDPAVLASFRRQEDADPSKCWSITRQCSVSEPRDQRMRLRNNTSTLRAVAGGKGTPVTVTCLELRFNSGKLWGSDKLVLCFNNAELARAWHAKLSAAIAGTLPRRALTPLPASPAEQPLHVRLPEELGQSSSHSLDGCQAVPSEDQLTDVGSALDSPTKAYLADMAADADSVAQPGPYTPRSWQSVYHTNGVTVYAEEEDEDGEGGGCMVSAVVRATPEDTFKGIMSMPFARSTYTMLGEAHILEVIDSHTQVLHQTWRQRGLLGRLWAPRDMVLLRTWRQDPEGTFIVMYQSTKHGSAPGSEGLSWTRPVRATIQGAGYTVSPLLPKYTVNGQSPECLVTLVAKMDLGGWLSPDSPLGRAALGGMHLQPWLEPMIQSVVALRDKVEQSRFVQSPTSMEVAPHADMLPTGDIFTTSTTSIKRMSAIRAPKSMDLGGTFQALSSGAAAAATDGVAAEQEPSLPKPSPEEEWAVKGSCHSCWHCPGSGSLKIRGKKYLLDKKKIPAAPPMFDLYAADLLDVDEPLWHVARFLPSVKYCPEPFMFIMQLMIPCSPPQSLTMVWTAPVNPMTASIKELLDVWEEDEQGTVRAFFTNFKSWLEGDGKAADKRRNQKFKLIPNVVKGSWIVRSSVGTTPVLLGQKLLTRYFRGPNYFEVDVDITANTVAASVTSLVVGAITSLVVDLNVLIEGQCEEELPERLLGSVRFNHLRLKNAAYLDEEAGKIYRAQAM